MDIRATLLDDEKSADFYFYNNGITMICDRFDFNALQRTDYVVRMKNVQVINGGQTCKTIHRTLTDNNSCAAEAHVLTSHLSATGRVARSRTGDHQGHEQPEPGGPARPSFER